MVVSNSQINDRVRVYRSIMYVAGICQGGHNGVGVVVHGSRVLLRLFRVCWSRKERMEEK